MMKNRRWGLAAALMLAAALGGCADARKGVEAALAVRPAPLEEPPCFAGEEPELGACSAACDRVEDCAVDQCAGFDWTSVGAVSLACHEACDADFAGEIAQAADCAAVNVRARVLLPVLADGCG